MFVDQAKIFIESGRGGSGCVSFRREKFVPKGGPDGGDGGKGGSVIFVANDSLRSLLDFQKKKHFKANRGEHGRGANCNGKNGTDIKIKVPVGTMVFDENSGELLADFVKNKQKVVIAKGGRGGRGNAKYKTSTKQAPRNWQVGELGEARNIRLELKVIADVGLVGFPNAGKSTFLSKVSAARPKIADYPFTTLQPNLGIVKYRDFSSFAIADIPGLIEGAHRGKGLGYQFLRHIERTRVLLFLVDPNSEEPYKDYLTLQDELKLFDSKLLLKPHLIALSKCDTQVDSVLQKLIDEFQKPVFIISSVTGEGIPTLLDELWKVVNISN
ncbi:MAG: GTPase ObgE [Deferribacteres bacterium]|nr:GTPase ObgE [candidate division KSB1 bacterium]MCB9502949.1 GTPase ObgE [Deferribacteres bacterium]